MMWLLTTLLALIAPNVLERNVGAAESYRRSIVLMDAAMPEYDDRAEAGRLANWSPAAEPRTERDVAIAAAQLPRLDVTLNVFTLASACERVDWGLMKADDVSLGDLVPMDLVFVGRAAASRAVVRARSGDSAGATDDLLAILYAARHVASAPGIDNKTIAQIITLAAAAGAAESLVHLQATDLARLDAALQRALVGFDGPSLAEALEQEWFARNLQLVDLRDNYSREQTEAALDEFGLGMVQWTQQQRDDFASQAWRNRMVDALRDAVDADKARLLAGEIDLEQWPKDRHVNRLGYWYWRDLNPDPRTAIKVRRTVSLHIAALRAAIAVLSTNDPQAAEQFHDPVTGDPLRIVGDADRQFVETIATVEVSDGDDGTRTELPIRVPLFDPILPD